MLPNLLKLIKFVEIVQKDEMHKILDYVLSGVFPFKSFIYHCRDVLEQKPHDKHPQQAWELEKADKSPGEATEND